MKLVIGFLLAIIVLVVVNLIVSFAIYAHVIAK